MFDEFDREIFAGGEHIFSYGDPGDCAYLIEEGVVEVFVVEQGKERRIKLIGKGELFGEVSLIDRKPRTATVRAIEKTVLVPIQRKLVDGLLEKSDPILRHLLLVILERFRDTHDISSKLAASENITAEQSILLHTTKGEATQKIALAHGMSRALSHEEFHLHYQPIRELADGRIAGFEALLRWYHPIDGVILPNDFLWIAEQTGFIREIGVWTIDRACRDWSELRRLTDHAAPFVSVNLSGAQLNDETLVDDLKAIVAKHNMNPAELKLELTETAMVDFPETALNIMNSLIELGCSIALDDYGAGHSGLGRLQRYPISTLKIDGAFINSMSNSVQSLEIVRSTLTLAHSLGMKVVAEGVERNDIRTILLGMGCEIGQGWLLGYPASLQDLKLGKTKSD
jgi:EAL domain-containing protein (putative c-di-GMP-specific phosphodiesterase class I)